MTRDPLVVNTKDGAVWQRRAVTRDGHGLYAVTGSCNCPEYLMATLAELAEHGIVGSADVLPNPVGPEPCTLDLDAIVSRALRVARQYVVPDEADQDDLDRLTDFDVPELVAEVRRLRITVAKAQEEIANHQPVLAALNGARARVAELEAGLPVMQTALFKALDRVSELEAERHTTNESLTEAAEALAALKAAPVTAYRAEHPDSGITLGHYGTEAAARKHCEETERRSWPTGTTLAFDWIEDDEDRVAELVVTAGQTDESTTGYLVTALELDSEYDAEADQ